MSYTTYDSVAGVPKHKLLSLTERVHPSSTALLVIDAPTTISVRSPEQGDETSLMPPMLQRLRTMIASARAHNILTIFVRSAHDPTGPVIVTPRQAEAQTTDMDLVPGLEPDGRPSEFVIANQHYGAFWGTEIDLVLRSNGIKAVICAGTLTEGSVNSNVRSAFFRGYFVVTAVDCCASLSATRHKRALDALRPFGVFAASNEIIDAWGKAPPTSRSWESQTKTFRLLATLDERVAVEHTALVLIDLQNNLDSGPNPNEQRGTVMIRQAMQRNAFLLNWARKSQVKVFHVRSEFSIQTGGLGMNHDPLHPACQPDSRGTQFADNIVPEPSEIVITKHRYSAFADTDLELLLRSNGLRTVVLAGMTTNCAIESTARDASARDFYAVVAEDCVATTDADADLHRCSLDSLRLCFALVEPAQTIAGAWQHPQTRTNQ
jgi:nicotinamidase-related amidase